jgi:hypothetical protein
MASKANRWTPAEFEIVASCTIAEAKTRLPHRTRAAIKWARRKLKPDPCRPGTWRKWTKAENRRMVKHADEPLPKLSRRFKRRSAEAVRRQRLILLGSFRPQTFWKTTELGKLKALWPFAPRSELMSAFPNRTWRSIEAAAEHRGWHRASKQPATSPHELREAVQRRAREDGVSLTQLGIQTDCGGHYFRSTSSKSADLNKIAKAVEFFGGKLVIDWQDE